MRNMVKKFRDEANEVLEQVAKKYGFTISQTNITYNEDWTKFSAKFSFENIDEDLMEAKRIEEFNILCTKYGFKPTDYNAKVVHEDGEVMRLIGFNTRARTNPCVLFSEKTHREYVAPTSYVVPRMKK